MGLRRRHRGIDAHHAEWLGLVDVSGPFLSLPVLARTFPQGLDADDVEKKALLRTGFAEWREHCADVDAPDRARHRAWVQLVLRTALEWPDELLREGATVPRGIDVSLPEHREVLRPDIVLVEPDDRQRAGQPRVLVQVLPAGSDLDAKPAGSRWSASSTTRMAEMLRGQPAGGARLGLLTNGERWMLVTVGEADGFVSWYASLWFEESLSLRAFRSLLGVRRLFGVDDGESLESLLASSLQDQHEVTDRLGLQVRDALEVLVQCIDRLDADSDRRLLVGVDEARLYEAAVNVMMRLVFLLYAEENRLLPIDDRLYLEHYAITPLREQLREQADRHGDQVLENRHAAWSRLLATSRALHAGISHDALRLPAYGGHLFDPDGFPFLEGRQPGTTWRDQAARPLAVDDRTVLRLLDALQLITVRGAEPGQGETQRLSFRALDVEQVGHVYESLLDHTARRAAQPILGLRGRQGSEPEVALPVLESLRDRGEEALVDFLKEEGTVANATALRRRLDYTIPPDDSRWLVSCGGSQELLERVRPWAGIVREGRDGLPVIVGEGGVYVTAGTDRRSTGTHYTPRSLTEPMVQYTLEPLVYAGPAEGRPRADWRLRTPADILGLRVCDMTCGSAAFLVQTCRYLSERLVEAWEQLEEARPGEVLVTPEGELSQAEPAERLVPRDEAERLVVARRLIAERCVYGVDKNPMAVEMAKLSLWLVTMEKGRPFTFLDHAIRCGETLLGVTQTDQLDQQRLTPRPGAGPQIIQVAVREAIDAAASRRKELESFQVRDIRDAERKAELLAAAERTTDVLRCLGDLLVGVALSGGEGLDPAMQAKISLLLSAKTSDADRTRLLDELRHVAVRGLDAGRPRSAAPRRPLHWLLAFPEVFAEGGFHAVVGNPPFQGGLKITGALGTNYRDYLVAQLAGGRRGSADLCAYFLLRASQLLHEGGAFGLLATNTVAQGDTREVGLEHLLDDGWVIYRAVRSRKWPGVANLEVSQIWSRRSTWNGEVVLDDVVVHGISALLRVKSRVEGRPFKLVANRDQCLQGSIVLGMGFVLSPDEARALIERDPKNREPLRPYLNGEDLNSRPDQSPSRWVINFGSWDLETAEGFPDCMSIVRRLVKPERDRLADGNATARDRCRRWWQFARPTAELYRIISGMSRVLVRTYVSEHHMLCFVPSGQVFANRLAVFATEHWSFFAAVQSNIHEVWARRYSGTLRTDLNYSPTDCFDTWPFPPSLDNLSEPGRKLHEHRAAVCREREMGLTKLYNCVHDPHDSSADIDELRRLHVALDVVVAGAYGWGNLDLGHGFHETDRGIRYTVSEKSRDELLDRLLALNHQRHAEEVHAGLVEADGRPIRSASNRRHSTEAATAHAPGLFDHAPLPAADEGAARVLAHLRQQGAAQSKEEILASTGLTSDQWPGLIDRLVDAGAVVSMGRGRGTRYALFDAEAPGAEDD